MEVAEACRALENVPIDFAGAPISGGLMDSAPGTLSFKVGTTLDVFSKIRSDLLIHIGDARNIFHHWEVGVRTAFKIINNYMSIVGEFSVSKVYSITQRMKLNILVLTDLQ